jgi:hypothetical protein
VGKHDGFEGDALQSLRTLEGCVGTLTVVQSHATLAEAEAAAAAWARLSRSDVCRRRQTTLGFVFRSTKFVKEYLASCTFLELSFLDKE